MAEFLKLDASAAVTELRAVGVALAARVSGQAWHEREATQTKMKALVRAVQSLGGEPATGKHGTATEADTELREMRAAYLRRLAALTKAGQYGQPLETTRRRIAAFNRAIQSLACENAPQGKLLDVPPKHATPGRSAYP